MAKIETSPKFIREYKSEDGKLESRWHYDRNINPYGPILVEEFNLPRQEKKVKKVAKSVT
jgi:hypothetical protein